MIALGDVARDTVSGFEGVVIGEHNWLHGCRRISLQPQILHDGKPIEAQSFDEPQLMLVSRAAVPTTKRAGRVETGGPKPEPQRRREPGR